MLLFRLGCAVRLAILVVAAAAALVGAAWAQEVPVLVTIVDTTGELIVRTQVTETVDVDIPGQSSCHLVPYQGANGALLLCDGDFARDARGWERVPGYENYMGTIVVPAVLNEAEIELWSNTGELPGAQGSTNGVSATTFSN